VLFVLNAAFSLRGLTSGALLGALILAMFGRSAGPRATMIGMMASLVVMNFLYWPPNIPGLKDAWIGWFGATPDGKPVEIFWPWFTLIGTVVTLSVAWLIKTVWPQQKQSVVVSPTEASVH
jgi:Na+/proline symporter